MSNKSPLIVLILILAGIFSYAWITKKPHDCPDCNKQPIPIPVLPEPEKKVEEPKIIPKVMPESGVWYSYDQAISLAKTSNKNVFIEFDATWCSWCKKLKKETLSDKAVLEFLNEKFVLCHVDYDQNKALAKKLNVRSLPTLVIVDSNGGFVRKIEGFNTAKQLLSWLNSK